MDTSNVQVSHVVEMRLVCGWGSLGARRCQMMERLGEGVQVVGAVGGVRHKRLAEDDFQDLGQAGVNLGGTAHAGANRLRGEELVEYRSDRKHRAASVTWLAAALLRRHARLVARQDRGDHRVPGFDHPVAVHVRQGGGVHEESLARGVTSRGGHAQWNDASDGVRQGEDLALGAELFQPRAQGSGGDRGADRQRGTAIARS